MKRITTRWLSLLLCLAVCLSLAPAALAAEMEEPIEELIAEEIPGEDPAEADPTEENPTEEPTEAPEDGFSIGNDTPGVPQGPSAAPVEEVPTEELPALGPVPILPPEDAPAEPYRIGPETDEPKATGTAIDETNFPDDIFRAWVSENADKNSDGILSESEAKAVRSIYVDSKGIEDLTGLCYFTEIYSLSCFSNLLTSLDVSGNPALEYLYCYNNRLTSLNVSGNQALKYLYCRDNRLTLLDVSGNPVLETLNCSNNRLISLDVSANTALKELSCGSNQLTSLIIGANNKLVSLNCKSNQLTSLDVSALSALTSINCDENQLTSLNVSSNLELETLYCSNNQLTALNVNSNPELETLGCMNNQLTSLNLSYNPELETLYCSFNQLASLDLSNNTVLGDAHTDQSIHSVICHTGSAFTLDFSSLVGVGNESRVTITSTYPREYTYIDGIFSSIRFPYYVIYTYDTGNASVNPMKVTVELSALFTVVYDANGGTGAPEEQTKTLNEDLTLSSIIPTRADASAGSYTVTLNANGGSVSPSSLTAARTTKYTFNNWNTAADGSGTIYAPNSAYTANSTATLYAQWDSSTTTADVALPTPSRDGYTFKGWSESESAADGITGSYTPDGDVTLYAVWEAVALPAPAISSIANTVSGVQLTWGAVSGAAKYAIYRKASGESKYTRISMTAGTSYTDRSAADGTYYYYRIWSMNSSNQVIGEWSTARGITCQRNVTPKITSIANTVNGVQLTWGAVPGVAKYAIYRKADGESKYTRISMTAATTYTDRSAVNGTYYYYRIWSMNSSNVVLGEWSSARAITCVKSVTPTITSIANTASGVKVTWGAVSGVAKYAIYRKAQGESKYTRISISSGTSYTDKSAVDGTYYYYRIWSMDSSNKVLGEWSTARAITCNRTK